MKGYPLTMVQIIILLILVALIDLFTMALRPLPEISRPILYLMVVFIVLGAVAGPLAAGYCYARIRPASPAP